MLIFLVIIVVNSISILIFVLKISTLFINDCEIQRSSRASSDSLRPLRANWNRSTARCASLGYKFHFSQIQQICL